LLAEGGDGLLLEVALGELLGRCSGRRSSRSSAGGAGAFRISSRLSPRRCSRGRVSSIAQRYGMHPSQLFAWRKAARDGRLVEDSRVEFAPVVIAPELPEPVALPPPAAASSSGRMEIALVNGRRVIVDASVNAAALARVIKVLERR
jgi:transposase-like protein